MLQLCLQFEHTCNFSLSFNIYLLSFVMIVTHLKYNCYFFYRNWESRFHFLWNWDCRFHFSSVKNDSFQFSLCNDHFKFLSQATEERLPFYTKPFHISYTDYSELLKLSFAFILEKLKCCDKNE